MSVTPASFRQSYPEFGDPQAYNDFLIDMHTGVALQFLNAQQWSTSLDFATMLWIAHHLSIGQPDQLSSAVGGVPGKVRGVQTAKGVDKVSGSYDAGSVSLSDQGYWGMSRYGIQLYQFALMFGAGGVQIIC